MECRRLGTKCPLPVFQPDMQKVEDYRIHAEDCRTMASRARSPRERDLLLNMARTWDDLAKNRVDQIARQQRIAALPGGDDQAAPASVPIDRLNASNDK
jgi:hypothetical protein